MARAPQTPIAFVRAIVGAYERYGVDPGSALAAARIPAGLLKKPGARVDAFQLETLAGAAMRELDDEALGWFSRRLPWGTYGMLCRASLDVPRLGRALSLWCRHHRLLTTDIELSLEVSGGVARVSIEENVDLGALREFCLVTSLRYVHGYACWLVDSQLPFRESTFPFAAPSHESVYGLIFPGPLRFGAKRASFAIDAGYLDLAPRRDGAAIDRMLKRALPLTVRLYRRDRLLVDRVRAYLASAVVPDATAEDVASAVHVSVRTLHRLLASEGAALQAIKDEVRKARAIDLLRRTDRSVKEVAHAAGFANEKSFSRAFKQWVGVAPSEYRR